MGIPLSSDLRTKARIPQECPYRAQAGRASCGKDQSPLGKSSAPWGKPEKISRAYADQSRGTRLGFETDERGYSEGFSSDLGRGL